MRACPENPLLSHAASPIKICFFLLLVVATTLSAVVVRPAPNVNWIDSSGRQKSLAALKGQPVIVVIAPTPRDWSFRSQAGQLREGCMSATRRTRSYSLRLSRESQGASGRTFPSLSLRMVLALVSTMRVARDSRLPSSAGTGTWIMSPTRSSRRSAFTMLSETPTCLSGTCGDPESRSTFSARVSTRRYPPRSEGPIHRPFPPGIIRFGWSKPTHTPQTSLSSNPTNHAS